MDPTGYQPRAQATDTLAYPDPMSVASAEQVALVALLRTLKKGERWSSVTESILDRGSAEAVWDLKVNGTLFPDSELVAAHQQAVDDLTAWSAAGYRMVGILDPAYPARLREIHQAPPFLFASGLLLADDPAIAIVGSRNASDLGIEIATSIATALASANVTVLSGLASGIDTAAHTAALAVGGRTVAIIGTGIAKQYPAANRRLQNEISKTGLVLSQFWPDAPPQKHNFLMRNAVMSGYGRATIVVEAGEQSGARAQARMAVEHGRPVILTDNVVANNEWARALVNRPGVTVASGRDQALRQVRAILDRDSKVDQLLNNIVGFGL